MDLGGLLRTPPRLPQNETSINSERNVSCVALVSIAEVMKFYRRASGLGGSGARHVKPGDGKTNVIERAGRKKPTNKTSFSGTRVALLAVLRLVSHLFFSKEHRHVQARTNKRSSSERSQSAA